MKISVKFSNDNGQVINAVFDSDANTVSSDDGRKGTYSIAEGSRTMELKGDVATTLTFADEIKVEPGHSMRYATPDGGGGSATIVSVQ